MGCSGHHVWVIAHSYTRASEEHKTLTPESKRLSSIILFSKPEPAERQTWARFSLKGGASGESLGRLESFNSRGIVDKLGCWIDAIYRCPDTKVRR